MSQKTFCLVAGLIFLFVTLLHVGMFFFNQSVIVFGQQTPVWSNLVIALFGAYFTYHGLRLRK